MANKNLTFCLAFNLPSEVELTIRRLYNQNDRKDFENTIVDCGFPLQYGDVIPDDIEQTKKLNSLILESMAEDYGSKYLKIENVGVSQNWTAVCKHLEPDETDMIVGVDPDEEPQEDGWIKACGDVLRADQKLAYVAPFLLDHHRNTFEKNPLITTKEIAGHEVYVTTANTNYGILALSGAFLNLIGGIPIPKDMKIYGGLEVELLRQVNLRGFYWGTLKNFTEVHTNKVPLYRAWKDFSVFRMSESGGRQISFEKWLQIEKTREGSMNHKGRKILAITGAAGFVGSNICQRIAEMMWNHTAIDDLRFGSRKNIDERFNFIEKDFNNLTEDELSEHETLLHCATSNIIFAMNNCVPTFQNNATNTVKLFEKFKGKIIYLSTTSVYGNAIQLPTPEDAIISTDNPYDQSKHIVELFLKQRGNYTTLRLSNVYGRNQRAENAYSGVVARFIAQAMKDKPIQIYGIGNSSRDYTYVSDVVDAVMTAIWKDAQNTEINIATGVETPISDLATEVFRLLDKPMRIEYVEGRKIDNITRRCLDISKAEKLLGWTPKVGLREGLERTIAWMKKEVETSEKILA